MVGSVLSGFAVDLTAPAFHAVVPLAAAALIGGRRKDIAPIYNRQQSFLKIQQTGFGKSEAGFFRDTGRRKNDFSIPRLWARTPQGYTENRNSRQLFVSKEVPQARQVTLIFPWPRGTRRCWPQLGHFR